LHGAFSTQGPTGQFGQLRRIAADVPWATPAQGKFSVHPVKANLGKLRISASRLSVLRMSSARTEQDRPPRFSIYESLALFRISNASLLRAARENSSSRNSWKEPAIVGYTVKDGLDGYMRHR
jgi:hypothetical protein